MNNNIWRSQIHPDYTVYYAGYFPLINHSIDIILSQIDQLNNVTEFLKTLSCHFGIIIDHKDFIFGAVDKTRSYPVYYNPDIPKISHNVRELKPDITHNYSVEAALQLYSAGYILGNNTLYPELKCLQAGECIYIKKNNSQKNILRYYQYTPSPVQDLTKEQALKEIETAINSAVKRVIEQADGKKIWLPLSGGLDSRIIAAKLHEFEYKNFECFSYGLKGNDEAKTARKVAKLLGVKWIMLPSKPNSARKLYDSKLRMDYERFAYNHSSLPSYVEFEAIHALKNLKHSDKGDLIVNGQSGDFISGDHIPDILYKSDTPCLDDMLDYMIEKHFSLWENIKTPQNIKCLKNAIRDTLLQNKGSLDNKNALISAYETFEWQERQSKMVVNAQRTYEFFGFDWALPLWDNEVMRVFEKMPFAYKYKRQLFVAYLKNYNHRGVFELPTAHINTWKPPLLYFMMVTGKVLEITKGIGTKDDFYKKASYYGHAHNQFALFGKESYDAHYKDMRNMISLSVLDFFDKHGIKRPD